MEEITLSQGLAWMKTLRVRYTELVALRDRNSAERIRRWGETKEDIVEKPVYDVKELDRMINKIGLELRKLDDAIKVTNAITTVVNYKRSDEVLGELS
jgi:hypothetical protein